MEFSLSTMLMAVFSSTIIIIFTAVCFCNRNLLVSFGYKMFAVLLGITFLRVILPIQFPFTANIVLPEIFSRAISFLGYYFYQSEHFNISIWFIFEIVWAIGILVGLSIFLTRHLIFNHHVVWQSRNLSSDERYCRLLEEICGDRPNPFWVFELNGLEVPVLYGIRHPRILIPAGLEIPDKELRYLLSHEATHHYHHDILIKLGLNLLTIVYWWNPACYVLRAQLDAVLEMRVDNRVAGSTFDSRFGYLNCLVYVAEIDVDRKVKRIKPPANSIALFNLRRFNSLTNRFDIMGRTPKRYARPLHIAALVVTVSLYLLSYTFIFEARYFAPEQEAAVRDTSSTGFYAVLSEENGYDIYFGNYLVETVDTLENHYGGMVVYNSLEDVPEELRVTISW